MRLLRVRSAVLVRDRLGLPWLVHVTANFLYRLMPERAWVPMRQILTGPLVSSTSRKGARTRANRPQRSRRADVEKSYHCQGPKSVCGRSQAFAGSRSGSGDPASRAGRKVLM